MVLAIQWYSLGIPELHAYKRAECYPYAGCIGCISWFGQIWSGLVKGFSKKHITLGGRTLSYPLHSDPTICPPIGV